MKPTDSMKTGRRCDYCTKPAKWIATFDGYISRSIRPLTGGYMRLKSGACEEHVGCPNWEGNLKMRRNVVVTEVTR